MEFRILKLNACLNTFGEFKMVNSDGLTIEKEQLINAYDFIIIYCDNNYHTIITPILKSQNYVLTNIDTNLFHNYVLTNVSSNVFHNKKIVYYYINNELKDNVYVCTGSGQYMNFEIRNKIFLLGINPYDYFQDKLPCFIFTRYISDVKYLENSHKITKIDVPYLYYLERKGQLTKAAIK
ncbi:hypothetical protein Hokovirus_2_31 [Hokovirus HKV1]|uniref:Uncharacterized protein n=1 Tax=Hokovirus HKV1 TaxID=1977638 RepID=A0A1V0SFT3_9VIRU|nr:hypothetical protein Hokovirus_2_31 [Hokovirus HKV1]